MAGASDSVESGAAIKSQNQIACRLDENEMIITVGFIKREHSLAVRVGRIDVGEIFAIETGEYMFEPSERRGAFPAWLMHKIADKLDELNEPLERDIQAYFENHHVESK